MPTDLKVLSKELGLPETDDIKVLLLSLEQRVQSSVVKQFAKGFGLESDGKDLDGTIAAIRSVTSLAKPETSDPIVQTRINDLENSNRRLSLDLDKASITLDNMQRRFEVAHQLQYLKDRITRCKELGKMSLADEKRLLTISRHGDTPVMFSLDHNTHDVEYDQRWREQYARITGALEEMERRREFSVVPKEKSLRVLDRLASLGPKQSDLYDPERREEALDEFWGMNKKGKKETAGTR